METKYFPRYWPFVRGIHWSPVNSPNKGQWRGALMFSLICVWINGWVNNREAGDLRRYRAHYDAIVMERFQQAPWWPSFDHGYYCTHQSSLYHHKMKKKKSLTDAKMSQTFEFIFNKRLIHIEKPQCKSVDFLWSAMPYGVMDFLALLWRLNGRDGVSSHAPHDCLLNRSFRRRSKKISKLRVIGLCVGNSLGTGNSPHKRPVTRKMFPFDDVIMGNVRLTDASNPLFATKLTVYH